MAIDKFGQPYGTTSPFEQESDAYATPDTAGSTVSNLSSSSSPSDGGFTDAQGADIGQAGVAAGATTAKAILNSIAAQNALNFASSQGELNRQSQGAMGDQNRLVQGQETAMHTARGSEGNQLQSGSTQVDAALGGQGIKDKATSSVVDRLAQLMSGNTKKRFGA